MPRWFWLACTVFLLIAAGSVWYAFQQPGFVGGLVTLAAGAAFKALSPSILKAVAPASPEELARQKANTDRGEEAGAVGNGPHNCWGRGKEK
jgi:hypothetical protein